MRLGLESNLRHSTAHEKRVVKWLYESRVL